MENINLIPLIISALGGGALASIFAFIRGSKKHKLDEFNIIIGKYKDMYDNVLDRLDEVETKLREVEQENTKLKEIQSRQERKITRYERER